MEKEDLRKELSEQLWKLSKLDIMVYLREFAEGETAAMVCLYEKNGCMTPSQISSDLNLSRSRVTNILRTLRGRGYVQMEMADDDRRKMIVDLTAGGREYIGKKIAYVDAYLDMYIDEMGEESVAKLTDVLKTTVNRSSNFTQKLKSLPRD